MTGIRTGGRYPRSVFVVLLISLAAIGGSCGGDDEAADSTTSATSTATLVSTTATSPSTTSDTDPSTTSTSSTSGTGSSSAGSTLPGEPIVSLPMDGDVLAVMGVAHDDMLNIRLIPGANTVIVATAEPTAVHLEATGEARKLATTIWYQVRVGTTTGWVNSSFAGFLGATDDATAEFLDGAELPVTETMEQLGLLVAEHYASSDPESTIVQSVAPTVGDLGEVTYDVIGLGDDSTAGLRLHVFGTPDEGGEGFVLGSIERTFFCARGVSDELCV